MPLLQWQSFLKEKSMIITIEDLQKFTQVYPDDNETQQDLFIQAANDIVCNYLRCNPEEKEYNIFVI